MSLTAIDEANQIIGSYSGKELRDKLASLISATQSAFLAGWAAYTAQQTESGPSMSVEDAWQIYSSRKKG